MIEIWYFLYTRTFIQIVELEKNCFHLKLQWIL